MSAAGDPAARAVLDADGPAAPPRRNGELIFAAPWESRLFGLTMALHRAGAFAWDDFRRLLIDEIAAWERAHPAGAPYAYYERWAAAFERLLSDRQLCAGERISERAASLAQRPPGHDH